MAFINLDAYPVVEGFYSLPFTTLGKVIATSLTICYQLWLVLDQWNYAYIEPKPPYFVVKDEPIIKPLNVVIG